MNSLEAKSGCPSSNLSPEGKSNNGSIPRKVLVNSFGKIATVGGFVASLDGVVTLKNGIEKHNTVEIIFGVGETAASLALTVIGALAWGSTIGNSESQTPTTSQES